MSVVVDTEPRRYEVRFYQMGEFIRVSAATRSLTAASEYIEFVREFFERVGYTNFEFRIVRVQ